MNIALIITRSDAVGGATVHVRDLALGLKSRGHRATVLVGGTGEVLDDFARHGVSCRSLRWLNRAIHPVKDALAVAELVRMLLELRPELVCTHTAKAGLLGRVASALLGIPALYTPHGWTIGDRISTAGAGVFRVAERSAAPLSAAIINVCEAERALARRHRIAPEERLAVIYNGVPDVDAGLRAQPEVSPPRILMVARFEEPKDHRTLLSAMASLRDLSWTLEFLGSGPKCGEMREFAGRLGLGARVIFTRGGTEVARTVAGAQVFVLSSRSEGLPLSILEAMRAGLPVVGSDVGGIAEAVADGETGFVVKAGDPAALAGALRPLLTDGNLRARLGRAGRRRYESHFTFEQMLGHTLRLYHSVLSASGAQAVLAKEVASGR